VRAVRTILAVVAAVLLSQACTTTPSAQFFTLEGSPPPAGTAPSPLTFALGPIDLPEYLDRTQIVTRAGGNRLFVDEFNRWGGPLYEEIDRVLTTYLAGGLGSERVYSYPSRVVADADYRVALEVRRFDGALGDEVTLDVAWSVVDDRTGDVVQTRQASYSGRAVATDYGAYAAALSELLTRLGDDLIRQLGGLSAPADQR